MKDEFYSEVMTSESQPSTADVCYVRGEPYTKEDVLFDRAQYNEGYRMTVPQRAYTHFSISRPTQRYQ